MTIWNIISNDEVINSVISDSKEFVESLYPEHEVIEDDGIIGTGWKKEGGVWKAPYPASGLEYIWNNEYNTWDLVKSPEEEPIVE